jgi:DNA-directed RNA polymerase subunit RPC12/RpoP
MPGEETPVKSSGAAIFFTCSECGKILKTKAELAGKKIRCTQCARPTLVPQETFKEPPVFAKSKWWLFLAVGGAGALAALVVGALTVWLWHAPGNDTRDKQQDAVANSVDEDIGTYESKLKPDIDKVKAGETNQIDARSYVAAGVLVVDKDLRALEGLTTLRLLNLDGTSVSNKGLKYVARVTSLVDLSLTNTLVDGAGLGELAPLINLEVLRLDGLQLSAAGLAHLKALPRLRRLSLYKTPTNDVCVEQLQGLSCLEWISLDETDISNDGLRRLAGLSKLKTVKVWNTKVNAAGKEEFQRLRPDVTVHD